MVKPPLRTKTLGTKLSEPEYAQLEAAARASGQTLSEWCRRVLLASVNGQGIKVADPMVAGMAAVHVYGAAGYFQHADWLGTSRLGVTGAGTAQYDRAYAPFGEPYVETASTNRDFTGQTEDTTPGLYDFLFRQQSQSQGRWLVPDPAGLAAVDLTNPQTWNRYAYVVNNPLERTKTRWDCIAR